MAEPIWVDGEPANLEAAAEDAREWLKYMLRLGLVRPPGRIQLERCERALQRCLTAARAPEPGEEGE